MKKLLAVLSAALILLSASACSKITSATSETSSSVSGAETTELVLYSDPNEAFSGVTLVENDDSTNIYYLLEDGTYKESYKGNLLSGKWEIQENEGFTALVLNMDGSSNPYQYMLQTDTSGKITGIYQYGGRSFTIKEYSIPDNITPTPYDESTTAATAAE